jgi:hypothetical protein
MIFSSAEVHAQTHHQTIRQAPRPPNPMPADRWASILLPLFSDCVQKPLTRRNIDLLSITTKCACPAPAITAPVLLAPSQPACIYLCWAAIITYTLHKCICNAPVSWQPNTQQCVHHNNRTDTHITWNQTQKRTLYMWSLWILILSRVYQPGVGGAWIIWADWTNFLARLTLPFFRLPEVHKNVF